MSNDALQAQLVALANELGLVLKTIRETVKTLQLDAAHANTGAASLSLTADMVQEGTARFPDIYWEHHAHDTDSPELERYAVAGEVNGNEQPQSRI